MGTSEPSFSRELDLRYAGQGYELRTPLDGLFAPHLTPASLAAARERFDARHAQIHGHAAKERPVELVSYRLRLRVRVPKYEPRAAEAAKPADGDARKGKRLVLLDGTLMEAIVYERERLSVGAIVDGPAIIEQFDATTVIPLSWRARVDALRNLILQRET
jgi:N-methylhydantoinase A